MSETNFSLPTGAGSILPERYNKTKNFDYIAETLATFLNIYYTPLLVCLGCIGNLISVFVFFSSKLRFQSTSLYLSALSLSDTLFLLQLVPPWLNAIHSTALFHQPVFCQIFVYTSYVSCLLSAWLVVAFTIERFVAVMYPLQRNSMCTMTRAKYIVGLLVLVALFVNIPVLRYASPGTDDCNIDSEYLEHAKRFNIVDTAVSFTLPLAIIFFLNGCIMFVVLRTHRERRAIMKIEQQEGALGRERLPPPPPALSSQYRVTRMLLIVSSVFILLNLPAYTMRVLAYAYDMRATEYTGRWAAVQQVSLMFFNTNFGINFILYCLSGQNFRRALCQAIPCLRRYIRRTEDIPLASIVTCRASSVSTGNDSAFTVPSSNSRYVVAQIEQIEPRVRRYLSEPVIYRWRFDNSRQLRTSEHPIGMDFIRAESPEHVMERRVEDLTPPPPPANRERTIPFLLFPYRNLIIPRYRNRMHNEARAVFNRNNSTESN